MSLLNLNTAVINAAREATRAGQRGMKRLHRKIEAQKNRVAFLEGFIESHQLTGQLQALEQQQRDEKRAQWEATRNG